LYHAAQVDLAGCVSLRPTRRRALAAGLAVAVLLGFALVQWPIFHRGLIAVLSPVRYVPAANDLELVRLAPGDAEVFRGEPLAISLAVRDEAKDLRAEVVFDGREDPQPMPATGDAAFELRLGGVHEGFRYSVRAESAGGRARWPVDRPWYVVRVREMETQRIEAQYQYPPYTLLPDVRRTLGLEDASLEAPEGTSVLLSAALSAAAAGGELEFRDGKRLAMAPRDGGRAFEASLTILTAGAYRMIFKGEDGQTLLRLPRPAEDDAEEYYPIRAIADGPPRVGFLRPNRDVELPPGSKLPLEVEATDDLGLTEVRLWAGRKGRQPRPVADFPSPNLAGGKKAVISFDWPLADFQEDDVIVYYAAATDNRNLRSVGGPQTTLSPKFQVHLRDAGQLRQEISNRLDELQRRLLEILQKQTLLRSRTEIARHRPSALEALRREGQALRAGQEGVRTALADLAGTFPFGPEMEDLRKAIALLAKGEARQAVDQARTLEAVGRLEQREALCRPLVDTQDAILQALQDMLSILPTLARQDAVGAPNGELSPDQRREKRRHLTDDLKRFIDEQRKLIDACKALAGKSPDDLTPADQELLNNLAALADQWEKFLDATYGDFSKLAEQDFANPSMLKELLSIKTDVTMAKDALRQKAVEVATACEDNAVENARELTANLEKWLPDEPDRKKWAMEATTEQDNVEQAELPEKLEDMVGDLLEEEEDLFEEADDLTSKATASGDKGIGWDAADGPISSMNAQGVTGNQLPNTSEIAGRSGEGRTGKSGGEFVADEAVGKGGRRTPTRMGAEPFQAGEVKDTSAEPPGGATGGGKISGAGAEGLEGQSPPDQKLSRLAGKQAALIHRADRIAAQLRIGDYSAFRLRQAVDLMDRVRRDLQAGDYRNALRKRPATLAALRGTQQMIGRPIEVAEDETAPLPKKVRDDIAEALGAKLPEEYRRMLEDYYRRLSEPPAK
jgi:hypothetical protein